MALGRIARPGGQQRQAVHQPVSEHLGGQDADVGGGKLDRQWQSVKPSDDVVQDSLVRHDGRQRRTAALLEESDPRCARQWRDLQLALGTDPQWRPAGHQDVQRRAPFEQLGDGWRGLDDLLEIVEHEQDAPVADDRRRSLTTAGRLADRAITSAGIRVLDRSTKRTPSGKSASRAWATRIPSRVLPTPPGPVSVSSRCPRRAGDRAVQLVAPPDQRRRRDRKAVERLDRPSGRAVQRRILSKDPALEALDIGRRVDPQLLDECQAQASVCGEGLRLAAAIGTARASAGATAAP